MPEKLHGKTCTNYTTINTSRHSCMENTKGQNYSNVREHYENEIGSREKFNS